MITVVIETFARKSNEQSKLFYRVAQTYNISW